MTQLVWNKVGERRFEAGLDHGVLYLPEGVAVPWNGLTAVEEQLNDSSEPYYLDGVKYMDAESVGDFAATLKAFTYPDEFEEVLDTAVLGPGFFAQDQKPKTFGLSYRTRIGNDLEGTDHGYKLHLLFDVIATTTGASFSTLTDSIEPLEFAWSLVATPSKAEGFRATAHAILDSTKLDPLILEALENMLYGTESTPPIFPTLQQTIDIAKSFYGSIVITDNFDGTWTATGPDENITMLNSTTFQITEVDATYIYADTYEVSTTELEEG